MEDIKSQQQEIEPAVKVGSGSLLAVERKKQKISIEEVAEKLNLSVTQLKTIELDQTEGLPGPTYVRGYIRGYAKLLDLDAEKILESYINANWDKEQSLSDLPRRIGSTDDAQPGFFTPAKLIVLLALAGLSSFLWYTGILDNLFKKTEAAPIAISEQVEQGQSSLEQTNETTASPVAVSNTENGVQEALANNIQQQNIQKPGTNKLYLEFSQTSWVDIRDENKKMLAFQSYGIGTDLTVESDLKMIVFIGNADGVTATLNGQPFDLTPYREGKYAKLTLDSPILNSSTDG